LYITPNTRKGGIKDRYPRKRGGPFFAKGGKMKKKKKKTELVTVNSGFSLIDENLLKSRIYTIRGVKVMLDADLAEIYGYSTGRFNEQVKYNLDRFDDDFRFQLTREESAHLISEIPISRWGGTRKMPYAFTEQGIYMLMTVLKGEQATAQSKALIRLFKQMKDYIIAENQSLLGTSGIVQIATQTAQNAQDIARLSIEMQENRDSLQKVMDNFIDPSTYKHFLILNGQRLDADIAYTQIYGMAKKSITIIDDYVGVKTLDLLRQIAKGVSVTIYSDNRSFETLTEQMQKDFLAVRPDVKFAMNKTKDKFHDRYIFLDYGLKSEKLFHCGASSKDAGNKITTIMQIEYTQAYRSIMAMLEKK
jgi:hypothetical protein